MHRRAFLAATTAVAVPLAGCGAAGGLSEDDYDVGMSRNAFLPRTFKVAVGKTVIWGNDSSRPHTVTAYGKQIPGRADYFASGKFDAEEAARTGWPDEGAIDPGETYEHTFEVQGTYGYFCIPHEPAGMVGEIIVGE